MAKGKRKAADAKEVPEHVALEKANDEEFQKQVVKKAKKSEEDRKGVVLLSHIPHGFFEPQMFSFFSQFGDVTGLKLIRSKKTGKSRSFAFIEFRYEEVAKVVAETMDNYLMYQKIMKCKLLPLDEVRPLTFKNWQKKFFLPKTRKVAIRKYNNPNKDPVKEEKRLASLKAKRGKLQKKLNDLGINYDVMNIKINESFVSPESPRAAAEEVARLLTKSRRKSDNGDHEEKEKKGTVDQKPGESIIEEDGPPEKGENQSQDKEEKKQEKEGNVEAPQDDNISKGEEQDEESAESTNRDKESRNESDFSVMVVDLDDSDITFKSPPPDARIKRRSVGISRKSSRQNLPDAMDSPERGSRKKRKAKETTASVAVGRKKSKSKLAATPGSKTTKKGDRTFKKKKSKLNKTM